MKLSLHHFGPSITTIHVEADIIHQPKSVSGETNPSILAHTFENASLHFQQVPEEETNEEQLINVDEPWCVQFSNGSLLQDQDSVVVQHCVQPMGDRDDRAK